MLGLSALPDFTWGSGDDELMGGASDPLSIRLNNPGAIRQSSVQWAGMAPEQGGPFVRFATPEAGIMAMSKNLDSYARRHGLTTIEGIVNRWAPPSENNTSGYVKRVADAMGVDPTQPLNLSDPAVKSALMEAMATIEAGKRHYTRDQIASVITGQSGGAQPMQQPYDEDQGLANIAAMGERVAGMQPPTSPPAAGISALGARPQPQGLSALSPYLQIASQLMPERQGRPWADALINAGAAMMQSNRPDFLGGLGAGLQAGNQALTQGQNLARQDTLDRFKLGMQLAQFDQKDTKPIALAEGGMLVTPDGQPVAANPKVRDPKDPLVKEFKEGDRIVTKQWNGAMWVPVSEATRNESAPTDLEKKMRLAGIDPSSPEGKVYAQRVLEAEVGDPTRTGFKDENTLRDEYTTLTKDYRTVQDAYNKIKEAGKEPSGPGDMSLLYGFVRMLDPGSVVRESEFATAAKSGSLPEQVQGWALRVINGERLPPEVRKEFLKQADLIYTSQDRSYKQVRSTYTDLAKRYNLKPENVLVEFSTAQPQGAAPAAPVPSATTPGGPAGMPPDRAMVAPPDKGRINVEVTTPAQGTVKGTAPMFDTSRRLDGSAIPRTPTGAPDIRNIPDGQEFLVNGRVYRKMQGGFMDMGAAP